MERLNAWTINHGHITDRQNTESRTVVSPDSQNTEYRILVPTKMLSSGKNNYIYGLLILQFNSGVKFKIQN